MPLGRDRTLRAEDYRISIGELGDVFRPLLHGFNPKKCTPSISGELGRDVRYGSKADIGVTPKSRHSLPRPACPLCAQKQTYAVQQKTLLFDHLVGAREHCPWNGKAKCFGGFQVYGQLVLGRRLYRKLGGFLTLEYAIDVGGRQPELFD